jgi:hypothetical protein
MCDIDDVALERFSAHVHCSDDLRSTLWQLDFVALIPSSTEGSSDEGSAIRSFISDVKVRARERHDDPVARDTDDNFSFPSAEGTQRV